MAVIIFAHFRELSEICPVGKILDDHIKNSLVPIEGNMPVPSLVFESSKIEKHEPKTTFKRKHGEDEKLEQELKAMPRGDAQKHCVAKALELSEAPDDRPEELMLYLRGLPMPEADGTAKVLHRIGANSKDAKLLSVAAQMQGKWLSTFSETRKGFIDDLANALKSDDSALRKRATESLGRSGSLDALPILLKELEARPGDQDIAAAIGRVLGHRSSGDAMDEGRRKELKNATADFLRSLENLRKCYDAQ
ncbi:MAG: HEAT repeat domain-containing protein [Victivallales bacterium]|nr:HEAT repeat domain-containing protein [Victivallales bacterium]